MNKIGGLMENEEDAKNSKPNAGDLLENIGASLGMVK